MDVSALHNLHEDLSEFLSEMTVSDLLRPVPGAARDMGALYVRLIDQNLSVVEAITNQPTLPDLRAGQPSRSSLGKVVDIYGSCGLESQYRQTAGLTERAFSSATDVSRPLQVTGFQEGVDIATLYEAQIADTVIHIWDVAHVLGLSYQPSPELALRALRAAALRIARPPAPLNAVTDVDQNPTFDRLLVLSGRSTRTS